MKIKLFGLALIIIALGNGCNEEYALSSVDKIRLSWNDSPATTLTIGWDQVSGENPIVYYGTKDKGRKWKRYKSSMAPSREISHLNMNTKFSDISGLLPDKAYYFVIKDSEGVSERFWFKTAPDKPAPFTYIMGGDTKSVDPVLTAGRQAHTMVSKLRPLFVVFCGDFTTGDGTNPDYWAQWLNDWFEYTRTSDGRLFPIVVVHGNHENGDLKVLNNIFNTPYQYENPENIYYSLSFGGDLFHMIVLNSEIEEGGDQRLWLEEDLKENEDFTFKLAAYHKPFAPHTKRKKFNLSQYQQWAYLFYEYGLNLSLDADSHMSKITFPVKPDSISGIDGFVREDISGTMFLGEGSWGASHRIDNGDKAWTLRSGSFQQFKWLQVFPETDSKPAHIDIRTVITSLKDSLNNRTAFVENVSALTEENVFAIPEGINLFTTEPYGDVITYPFTDIK